MKPCLYVKRTDDGRYEYGRIEISDAGGKTEKRKYVKAGTSATYEKALRSNSMAEKGMPRIGTSVQPAYTWN